MTALVRIPMTRLEREAWRLAAEADGMTLAAWVRMKVRGDNVT